ncbi:MAG TPA: hypothetical protein VK165_01750 [Azonexus sp.]|nr:hypothetical protein [Azonexus sp.]
MAQARAGSEKSSERHPPGRAGQQQSEARDSAGMKAERGGSEQFGKGQDREGQDREQGQARGQKSNGRGGQEGGSGEGRQRRSESINMATGALRSFGQFCDMQAATARIMWRAQIRAASAFGLPDYSRMLEVQDDRATRLFSAATDNLVQFVDQEGEVLNEVPSQVFRLFEKQAIDVTERWKYGLKEFQQQATQSLEELKELARQQAEEMSRATEMLSEASTASLRESGEDFRNAARQGREAMSRQGQEMEQEMRGEEEEGGERGQQGRDQEASSEESESSSRRRAA